MKLTGEQIPAIDWAKDVVYNAAGQMTSMKCLRNQNEMGGARYLSETWQYSVRRTGRSAPRSRYVT